MSSENPLEKIKKLREITGVGFKDCKIALDENKGDIDKLCRSTLDALTLSAIADDSQVVSLEARKYYCDKKYTMKPHSMITIQTIS